mgnify:CR=1 FL=1
MSAPSSRKRKQAALPSDLPPAASKCGGSDPKEPSEPTGTKYVPCHSGELGPDSKLVRFKDAPAHFRPVLTPRQMLLAGMHGGIYFNPKGGKPGVKYPRNKYPNGIPGVGVEEVAIEEGQATVFLVAMVIAVPLAARPISCKQSGRPWADVLRAAITVDAQSKGVRLEALLEHGGIYLDMDSLVLKDYAAWAELRELGGSGLLHLSARGSFEHDHEQPQQRERQVERAAAAQRQRQSPRRADSPSAHRFHAGTASVHAARVSAPRPGPPPRGVRVGLSARHSCNTWKRPLLSGKNSFRHHTPPGGRESPPPRASAES